MNDTIDKVSIIISHGSLEGVYPGLIMANGARMEGIEVKVATVGNPGLHLATMVGGLPGMSSFVTHQMEKQISKLDIPPVPEFIQMIADSGAKLYACKASVDMFGLERDEFIDELEGVITVGEFYAMAGGGQIIFT
jgi:peroxiredoxin family protein